MTASELIDKSRTIGDTGTVGVKIGVGKERYRGPVWKISGEGKTVDTYWIVYGNTPRRVWWGGEKNGWELFPE